MRTVSAVIPTRGRPDLVTNAVRSALAQTEPPLEVIVVVDGQDGDTRLRLERLGDPRVRVVETQVAVGGAEARNIGVREALADWVALLDDDDEWLPEKLERQLNLALALGVPYPIVACRLIGRSERDYLWPARLPRPGEDLSEYLFARGGLFQGEGLFQSSMLLTSRALLRRVPFTTGLPQHQDWDWILRASAVSGAALAYSPEPLCIWHLTPTRSSVSKRGNWRESIAWIEGVRSLVTDRAYGAFLLTVVSAKAREDGDWGAARYIAREASRRASPNPILWVVFLGIWMIPRKMRWWLRSLTRPGRRG